MIKLIASDIDGTLVPEGSHVISPEYFKVIEEGRSRMISSSSPATGPYSEPRTKFFTPGRWIRISFCS